MGKKPSESRENSFCHGYVSVLDAIGYASFYQRFQVSNAISSKIAEQVGQSKIGDNNLINLYKYDGFFNGYGMENIPVGITIPISDEIKLNFGYSIVGFRFGNTHDALLVHSLCTDRTLHYHCDSKSSELIRAVDKFNQENFSNIIQMVPINYGKFIWGNDSPIDPPEKKFTLALTDQPTLLLPPSPEGAQRIGEYLVSSGVISR
jgi:hypothetical protein